MENISAIEPIEKIKQGKLYPLLSICSNEELDPLVKYIIENKFNCLCISPLYKMHQPNHKKYYMAIGDEILSLGHKITLLRYGTMLAGHTITPAKLFLLENIIINKKYITYKEVVQYICALLSIPCKKDDVIMNEKDLISLYKLEGNNLPSLTTFNPTNDLLLTASNLLTEGYLKALSPMLFRKSHTALFTVFDCIIYIANLRQKKIKEYHSSFEEQAKSYSKICTNEELVILYKENNLILSSTKLFDLSTQQDFQSIEISKSELSRLNSLIQSIPNWAITNNIKNTKYMEVSIGSGSLAKMKGGGYRGFSTGDNGKITEHAKIFDSSKLSKLAKITNILTIVSFAVGQKHLADISAKLTDIKNSLKSIENFQKNERESKIKGSILYFEQIANSVINGNIIDSILNQIEAKECELLETQVHLIKDINSLNSEKNLKGHDAIGTQILSQSIAEFQDNIYNLYSQLLLCIRARACGWQLLSYHSTNDHLMTDRYNDIRKSLDSINDTRALINTNKFIKKQIKEINSSFNTYYTENERKLSLLMKNENNLENITININEIKKELAIIKQSYQMKKDGNISFLLKVDKGEVVGICPSLSDF